MTKKPTLLIILTALNQTIVTQNTNESITMLKAILCTLVAVEISKQTLKLEAQKCVSADVFLSIRFGNLYPSPSPPALISHSSDSSSRFINFHKDVEVLCTVGDTSCPTGRIINLRRRRRRNKNESKPRRPNCTQHTWGILVHNVDVTARIMMTIILLQLLPLPIIIGSDDDNFIT